MKILIADDDRISRILLESTLSEWGHVVVSVPDGLAAWKVMSGPDAPSLAILDWEMPGLVGPEVCRKIRSLALAPPPYLLLLTSKEGQQYVAAAHMAGANDYLAKPFDPNELRVRLDVGMSMLGLQTLEANSRELERRVQGIAGLSARGGVGGA